MPLTDDKIFRVDIDDERLLASIAVNGELPTQDISADDILKQITLLHIKVDPTGKENIKALAKSLAEKKRPPNPLPIANGTPPVHDQNGKVEKLYEKPPGNEPSEKESEQSHYDRSDIITVSENQEILRLIPPISGNDGIDVFGKPIPRKLGKEAKVILGKNVTQKDDLIIATSGGRLFFDNGKAWINPVLDINGNVDFSTGNIDFPGEVIIAKNVLDLFKVRSKATISIHGLIEAAEIHAGLDLYATGGVTGKEKGKLYAANDIHSKYLTNAHVRAGKNIFVQKEIVNCDLACGGALNIENGLLGGGVTIATGGIKVKDLGSEAEVKTHLEVGIAEDLKNIFYELSPKIIQQRQQAQKIRQTVEPLLQNQKHLNAEQKEKATELLYAAADMEDSIEEAIEKIRTAQKHAQEISVPQIEVAGTLYPGVLIRFPRVETVVKNGLKGPLTIKPKKSGGTLRIIAVDNKSNTHDLGANAAPDDFWSALARLLAPPKNEPVHA